MSAETTIYLSELQVIKTTMQTALRHGFIPEFSRNAELAKKQPDKPLYLYLYVKERVLDDGTYPVIFFSFEPFTFSADDFIVKPIGSLLKRVWKL